MKNYLFPVFITTLMLIACQEERFDESRHQKEISFSIPDFVDESQSRINVNVDESGAHFIWQDGDVLGVFPMVGDQTSFPISGGAGTNTAVFDGADWALRPTESYAAYFPLQRPLDAIDKSAIEVSYLGQHQNVNGSTACLSAYDYLACGYRPVDEQGNVCFDLKHLGCLVRFQLTMPEEDTYYTMELSCDGVEFPMVCKYDLNDENPTLSAVSLESSISLSLSNEYYYDFLYTTESNQVLTLYMMLPPMDLSGKEIIVKILGFGNDFQSTFAGKNMKAGYIYGYTGKCDNVISPQEAVDLGLSVKWATCNLGTSIPEALGYFYAWGETDCRKSFDWSNYKFCRGEGDPKGGSSLILTKYCVDSEEGDVDNKEVLDPEDDAATVNWGGLWRMPTYDELQELVSQCSWIHINEFTKTGYEIVGPNGNSIFLPCGSSIWGASLDLHSSFSSYCLTVEGRGIIVSNRDEGHCVRPVMSTPDYTRVSAIRISGDKTQLNYGETLQLAAIVEPSNANNPALRWESSNISVATVSDEGLVSARKEGSVVITAAATDGSGISETYEITVINPHKCEFVDLGCNALWATYNVGSKTPADFGDYYSWGETEVKGYYNWQNYKYCDGRVDLLTKYCRDPQYGFVDYKRKLDDSDDVANLIYRDDCWMPALRDFCELIIYCYWEWTENYRGTGTAGYIVYKAKSEEDCGKISYNNPVLSSSYSTSDIHIFFPATGYISQDSHIEAGAIGYYATSEVANGSQAFCFIFSPTSVCWSEGLWFGYVDRCVGIPVRPVCYRNIFE